MQTIATRQPNRKLAATVNGEGRVHLKSILALATLLRLGTAWWTLTKLPKDRLFHEALDLGFLAQSLNSGHGFSSPFGGTTGPTALMTPGYPVMIALIFRLFGSYSVASAAAVMALQIIFNILTIAVLMHVARRLFGTQTANLAGLFWAVSLPLLWMPEVFWYTSLSALFLIGAIALALSAVEHPRKHLWLLIGAYCGMVMLVNPSPVLAMLAIFTWAAYQSRLGSRQPLMGLVVMLAVFAPWPIRNAKVLHAFVPLRSSFGYELWQGNRAGGDGFFDDALYPTRSKEEYDDYASKGELAYMREKSTLARIYIHAHPDEFLRLTAKRVARFWAGTGERENSGAMVMHIVITSLLGLLGLGMLFRKRKTVAILFLLPILLFPLPYYITDIKFRYRLEIDPILTILGAYAVIQLNTYLKSRRSRIGH